MASRPSWLPGWVAADLTLGVGLRANGDFQGQRIQNGFHRLVGSDPVDLPYTGTRGMAATGWIRIAVGDPPPAPTSARWRPGYWLHVSSLVDTDGGWDGTGGA